MASDVFKLISIHISLGIETFKLGSKRDWSTRKNRSFIDCVAPRYRQKIDFVYLPDVRQQIRWYNL